MGVYTYKQALDCVGVGLLYDASYFDETHLIR